MSGHLAHKKMIEHLKRLYTWPGIGRDIQIWCKSCGPCQRIKKGNIYKAPLKPLPVIEAPNEIMAFDLVGPFPRSKDGFKYVLTGICLHSKFPEGIPLKDVKAETVAEGLVDIFCRTGVPKKILTDQ